MLICHFVKKRWVKLSIYLSIAYNTIIKKVHSPYDVDLLFSHFKVPRPLGFKCSILSLCLEFSFPLLLRYLKRVFILTLVWYLMGFWNSQKKNFKSNLINILFNSFISITDGQLFVQKIIILDEPGGYSEVKWKFEFRLCTANLNCLNDFIQIMKQLWKKISTQKCADYMSVNCMVN